MRLKLGKKYNNLRIMLRDGFKKKVMIIMIMEFSIEGSAPPHPTLLWKNNKKNDRNGSKGRAV